MRMEKGLSGTTRCVSAGPPGSSLRRMLADLLYPAMALARIYFARDLLLGAGNSGYMASKSTAKKARFSISSTRSISFAPA